jgi:hypothetical protein
MPNIDGIVMNPKGSEVPTEPAVLYAVTGALAHKCGKDNFDRISEYVDRMPPEFQVMLMADAMKLKPEIKNTKAFSAWCIRNPKIMGIN